MSNNLYIKATATGGAATSGWTRNPDWLTLPVISSTDDRAVALFLVFEGEYNQMTFQTTVNTCNIDWGDGTNANSTGALQVKVYDYAALSGDIFQYYDGRNYKQVIIDVTKIGTLGLIFFDRNSGVNNGGCINIVDMSYSLQVFSFFSAQRRMLICERFWAYKNEGGSGNNTFQYMSSVQSFNYDMSTMTSMQLMFFAFGGVLNTMPPITAGSIDNAFSNCHVRIFEAITGTFTSLSSTWITARMTQKITSVNCSAVTTMANAWNGAHKLRYLVCDNCQLVTVTTSMFNAANSLAYLEMNGLKVSFTVANCNLNASAINTLGNSVFDMTSLSSPTVTITGNPYTGYDSTIWTNKNWTIIG